MPAHTHAAHTHARPHPYPPQPGPAPGVPHPWARFGPRPGLGRRDLRDLRPRRTPRQHSPLRLNGPPPAPADIPLTSLRPRQASITDNECSATESTVTVARPNRRAIHRPASPISSRPGARNSRPGTLPCLDPRDSLTSARPGLPPAPPTRPRPAPSAPPSPPVPTPRPPGGLRTPSSRRPSPLPGAGGCRPERTPHPTDGRTAVRLAGGSRVASSLRRRPPPPPGTAVSPPPPPGRGSGWRLARKPLPSVRSRRC
jgi:hypothetical protein